MQSNPTALGGRRSDAGNPAASNAMDARDRTCPVPLREITYPSSGACQSAVRSDVITAAAAQPRTRSARISSHAALATSPRKSGFRASTPSAHWNGHRGEILKEREAAMGSPPTIARAIVYFSLLSVLSKSGLSTRIFNGQSAMSGLGRMQQRFASNCEGHHRRFRDCTSVGAGKREMPVDFPMMRKDRPLRPSGAVGRGLQGLRQDKVDPLIMGYRCPAVSIQRRPQRCDACAAGTQKRAGDRRRRDEYQGRGRGCRRICEGLARAREHFSGSLRPAFRARRRAGADSRDGAGVQCRDGL